jgi:hypothetical protein
MNNTQTKNTTLSIRTPFDSNYNSSFINLTISQLRASSYPYILENYDFAQGPSVYVLPGFAAFASFKAFQSCNLTEISLYHSVSVAGDLRLLIYPSTWNGTTSVPNWNWGTAYATFGSYACSVSGGVPTTDGAWNSYSGNVYLNNSQTDNATWFVSLDPDVSGGGEFYWFPAYTIDTSEIIHPTSHLNHTSSFQIIDFSPTILHDTNGNNVEFLTTIQLTPDHVNPTPSQVGLMVNQTAVTDWTEVGYCGQWTNTSAYNGGGKGQFEVNITATWPNLSWIVNTSYVLYKNSVKNQSTFYISDANSNVQWSVQYKVDNYESENFTDFRINFTVPTSWTPNKGYYNGSDTNCQFEAWNLTTKEQDVEIIESNGYGNGTWVLNLTGYNEGKSIELQYNHENIHEICSNQTINIIFILASEFTGLLSINIINLSNSIIYSNHISLTNQTNSTISNWDPIHYIQNIFGEYLIKCTGTNVLGSMIYLETKLIIKNCTQFTTNIGSSNSTDNDNHNNEIPNPDLSIFFIISTSCIVLINVLIYFYKKRKIKVSKPKNIE